MHCLLGIVPGQSRAKCGRIQVIAIGYPLWGEAQLAVDTTLGSRFDSVANPAAKNVAPNSIQSSFPAVPFGRRVGRVEPEPRGCHLRATPCTRPSTLPSVQPAPPPLSYVGPPSSTVRHASMALPPRRVSPFRSPRSCRLACQPPSCPHVSTADW